MLKQTHHLFLVEGVRVSILILFQLALWLILTELDLTIIVSFFKHSELFIREFNGKFEPAVLDISWQETPNINILKI